MKTKNLFRVLPAVAAVLLFAACSGDDQNVAPVTEPETPAGKGTVIHYSATVSDGTTTRATLNSSKEYVFQEGDVLKITGTDITGELTLTSGAGEATANFAGDLTYTGSSGTPADDLELQAVLVSTSNQMTTLTYASATYPTTAIASTLAEAVQKYSHFTATSTYANKNFSLDQQTSFLNFTVTLTDGTTAGTALGITITNNSSTVRTGTVTTVDDSGIKAKFVAAMPADITMSSATFQLGSKSAVSFGGTTELVANKIYNISKTIAASSSLTGQFSVSTTKKVCFSKGNLRATYDGSSWTWAFAENQWDYIGDATTTPTGNGNTSINGNGTVSASNVTVDLFGWVGASSTWTDVAQYGITSSYATNDTNGYGTNASEALKSDWGNTISDGYTWFTLSSAEWQWMLGPSSSPNPGTNCRTSSTIGGVANARWVKAVVHSTNGLIIYPDALTWNEATMGTAPTTSNTANNNFTYNTLTDAQWSALEAAGCVFLPAAGNRRGTSVSNAGSCGYYWSSSPLGSGSACYVYFSSGSLNPADGYYRRSGSSVRLVRQVE